MNGVLPFFDWKSCLTFLPLNLHVNDSSLVKIVSLKYVNNIPGVRGTIYTSTEKAMNMILRDVTVLKFKEYG